MVFYESSTGILTSAVDTSALPFIASGMTPFGPCQLIRVMIGFGTCTLEVPTKNQVCKGALCLIASSQVGQLQLPLLQLHGSVNARVALSKAALSCRKVLPVTVDGCLCLLNRDKSAQMIGSLYNTQPSGYNNKNK